MDHYRARAILTWWANSGFRTWDMNKGYRDVAAVLSHEAYVERVKNLPAVYRDMSSMGEQDKCSLAHAKRQVNVALKLLGYQTKSKLWKVEAFKQLRKTNTEELR